MFTKEPMDAFCDWQSQSPPLDTASAACLSPWLWAGLHRPYPQARQPPSGENNLDSLCLAGIVALAVPWAGLPLPQLWFPATALDVTFSRL